MLSINTNLSSLIAQSSMKSSTNKLNQAIERMTTGFKINHAKDNAANYSISTNMTTKIGAYNVAEDNAAMGLDLISTAEGTLDQIQDKLQRLRALAEQASNGTYGEQSKQAINAEANALVDEIARLYSTAEYNGIKLFSDSASISAPIMATFAMRARAASFGYSDEEIAEMTTLSEAYEAGVFVEGETYSISSVDELEKFRDMVNAGNSGAGSTFVLTKDLNLSGISNWTPIGYSQDVSKVFSGVFDGNGHVISNLKINDTSGAGQGLFGSIGSMTDPDSYTEVKNLGLENVNINGGGAVGALAGVVLSVGGSVNIYNNYSTGTVFAHDNDAGGLVAAITAIGGFISLENNYSTVSVGVSMEYAGGCVGQIIGQGGSISLDNNFTSGNVSGAGMVGGLAGEVLSVNNAGSINLNNNYATGTVDGGRDIGGLIGSCNGSPTPTITNCASVQADSYAPQKTANEILSPANLESMGFSESNGWTIKNGLPVHNYQSAGSGGGTTGGGATGPLIGSNQISLQVGIGSDSASQIGVDTSFVLASVDDLRMIGLDLTTDYLTQIDDMLELVSEKQTHFGAVSNRLESVLEEITIQRDNLVSSRSTIRDADIAEVSSHYIQQQILQQASATLLATANQSPAIALQLI